MTTSDAETRISRFFLLSEYDMTSDREANKHENILSEYDWATRQRTNKREFLISEYEDLTRGKVTVALFDCYKSTLLIWIWSISWFLRIFKDHPLSKIRKFKEIDKIPSVNNIVVENQNFTENY